MTRKDAYRETLRAFRAGKIDILVGTQMIAKGLHFPNVTLVGIINADLDLHLPDFRAGERTFQLLTQVAGRAGPGDIAGEVFVQTFTPFSPSIQLRGITISPAISSRRSSSARAAIFRRSSTPFWSQCVQRTKRVPVLRRNTRSPTVRSVTGGLHPERPTSLRWKNRMDISFSHFASRQSDRAAESPAPRDMEKLPLPEDVVVRWMLILISCFKNQSHCSPGSLRSPENSDGSLRFNLGTNTPLD